MEESYSQSLEIETNVKQKEECIYKECPICYEKIEENEASMRCNGISDTKHYFHEQCLSKWIQSCNSQSVKPTCPICRGDIEIHRPRLEEYLNNNPYLDTETQTNLYSVLHNIDKNVTDWTGVTGEQIMIGISYVTWFAYGFYCSFSPSYTRDFINDSYWVNSNKYSKTSYYLGLFMGYIARISKFIINK